MLTIGQLADYVGVTPRAIRFYHQRGLLPEPERTASGYRSYTAQDVVDLQRIKVLTDAGVPLARVKDLVSSSTDELRAAIEEIDADLRARIRALQRTRKARTTLGAREPFLPPGVADLHTRLRNLSVSESTLARERDAWTLVGVLYPDLLSRWLEHQLDMLRDDEFRELYLLTEQVLDDDEPDDELIDQIARRTVTLMAVRTPPDRDDWDLDETAYRLVSSYQSTPALDRLRDRIQELVLAGTEVDHNWVRGMPSGTDADDARTGRDTAP